MATPWATMSSRFWPYHFTSSRRTTFSKTYRTVTNCDSDWIWVTTVAVSAIRGRSPGADQRPSITPPPSPRARMTAQRTAKAIAVMPGLISISFQS